MEYTFDDLKDKVCVLTGGSGVIGSRISEALGSKGVKLAILGIEEESMLNAMATDVSAKTGNKTIGVHVNVLEKASLAKAKEIVNEKLGSVDILINCAGGNNPKATTGAEILKECNDETVGSSFFGLDPDCFKQVMDLNSLGTVLPSMVFGIDMAKKKKGVVLNISSMASYRPLTKVVAYSAAKASVNNFTQWLAVHLAKVNVRVNAIAPGFLLTKQNEYLMIKDKATGELSDRGKSVIGHTPMGRFGNPEELCGAILFLVSDMSSFITGVVMPIDGGFNVYAGV